MNYQETTQVITLLAGNYDSIAKKDKTQKQLMISTWLECLSDLDYNLVLRAVKKSIMTNPCPPTIYDIRKNAADITNTTKYNTLELWDECYKMICSGGYMTQEEFDQHSLPCKKFLGSLGQLRNYARSDINVINTVVKGQFMKQCDFLIQSEKENALLPDNIKKIVGQLSVNLDAKQITN